jgi:hypothetical protein
MLYSSNALLDERGDQVHQHLAAPRSQSVYEEPIMTFEDSTPLQQPTERSINFASSGKLYQLRPDATPIDVQDQLHARLSQLHAMLTITCGNGFETFENWSDEIKDNYLWSCSMLAKECKELVSHV